MTTHATSDTDELRRLAEAATPGPWRARHPVHGSWIEGSIGDLKVWVARDMADVDADFAVAACNSVLVLLDERDALKRQVGELREALEQATGLLGDHGPDEPRTQPKPIEALWHLRAALAITTGPTDGR